MTISLKSTKKQIEITPSDLDQSVVRVLLVSSILLWSYFATGASSITFALTQKYFILAYFYWIFSVLLYLWTSRFLTTLPTISRAVIVTRVVSIFADIGALSAYTAISGEFGIVLLPVYMTSIIGYGYRFGVAYLHLTLIVSLTLFTIGWNMNAFIQQNQSLIWAYYLGIIVVPLYSASLLRKHREILERINEVNEARSRFIANMSHELRTPLHAIISVSDVLRERTPRKGGGQLDADHELRMISDSAQHLLTLVNRVLDVASAEAGKKGRVKLSPINLPAAALTAIRICRPSAQEKKLRFDWFIDTRIPVHVMSSTELLQEILINTIGNAIKYTQEGKVSVRLELIANGSEGDLRISVVDTGCGISATLLPTIFEPFTLGDDSAARRYSGTGLGLTLTKQYVEDLGGAIYFESTEKQGTRCTVLLPIRAVPRKEPVPVHDGHLALDFAVLASRMLSFEEHRSFTEFGWSYSVYPTLELLHETRRDHDIVVVDCACGEGFETVCSSLRKAHPIAMIVGYSGPEGAAVPLLDELNCVVSFSQSERYEAFVSIGAAAYPGNSDIESIEKARVDYRFRVLVADDNGTNLATAQLALESVGHTIVTVSNGEDALVQLDSNQFDLALIDMHMPIMSGVEVAKIYQFMGHRERTPIVILTADATEDAREASEESGAVAFLTKPLRANELRRAVQMYSRRTEERPSEAQPAMTIVSRSGYGGSESAISELEELLQSGVSVDALRGLVHEFDVDSRTLLERAAEANARSDFNSLSDVLHSLRGAAGALGAAGIIRIVEGLEKESPAGIFESYRQQENGLREATADAISLLASYLNNVQLDSGLMTRR